MMTDYVLALDLGTTSAKAVLFTFDGRVIEAVETLVESKYPEKDYVEQSPEEIEQASIQAIREVIEKAQISKERITGIGISCAMHSLICVDGKGRALTDAIIWADRRSHKEADHLKENNPEIYEKTGVPIHPMSPFTKLIWMRERAYPAYEEATYFMSVKEYLLYKWYGRRLIDYSMAVASGLMNIHTLTWDEALLKMAGVQKEQLSEIVPPTTVLTNLSEEVASKMGIRPDTPLAIGSADGQLANLGSGAILPGEVAITAGTSGAIRQMSQTFETSEKGDLFCYPFTDELSIIGGPTNNGGIALQWAKDLFAPEESYDTFVKSAEKAKIGADGLLFFPYLQGERAPLWQAQARGNFFGLSITHKKEHFVRAVLEGITFNLYHIGQSLEKVAGPPEKIYVNGGLARSDLWIQMLADMFHCDVYVSESHHSAAWGAAWTCLVALEKVPSFQAIKENIPIAAIVQPDEERHKKYRKIFAKYEALVQDLVKHFN